MAADPELAGIERKFIGLGALSPAATLNSWSGWSRRCTVRRCAPIYAPPGKSGRPIVLPGDERVHFSEWCGRFLPRSGRRRHIHAVWEQFSDSKRTSDVLCACSTPPSCGREWQVIWHLNGRRTGTEQTPADRAGGHPQREARDALWVLSQVIDHLCWEWSVRVAGRQRLRSRKERSVARSSATARAPMPCLWGRGRC